MTASLYHSGSSSCGGSAAGGASSNCSSPMRTFMGAVDSRLAHAQDVSGPRERVELDLIARALPGVARAVEEVVDLEAPVRVDAELGQRERGPARLPVVGIEVHGDQYDVGKVGRRFRVAENLVVVGRVERKAPVVAQGGVVAPDGVQPGDHVPQAVAARDVPVADLVFLGIE